MNSTTAAPRELVREDGPTRVVFGEGSARRLSSELDRIGARRALVLATPGRRCDAEELASTLGERSAGVFAEAKQHVPVETARAGRDRARAVRADWVVAYGGGSTVGLAKAIALENDVGIASVPTTYSGSEMTPIWGLTEAGRKRTGKDERVRSRLVIYDPRLTISLPLATTVTSLFNAMAHAVEALYAESPSPEILDSAERSIRSIAVSLRALPRDPEDVTARSEALYGAYLAGVCLSAGVALHHKLCHVLGGTFGLPHAETHTVVLPHAARFNADVAEHAMRRLADSLGVTDGPRGLFDLARETGAPASLEELGLARESLELAADLAVEQPYYNPKPVDRAGALSVLSDAFSGRPPTEFVSGSVRI